jgi:Holliday junction resolvase
MRRAAKTDKNQQEIVKAFRQIGATVQILSAVGKGCPDVLVGFRGSNVLVEIKDGDKVESAQKLTADQRDWHASWNGQVCVANSISDAVTKVIRVADGREVTA